MSISLFALSRLFCRASEYNFAASSRNLPNNAARASLSAASRCARACACCVAQEVANEVRPPMAVPASAAKADMYAASIGFSRAGCRAYWQIRRLYDELIGAPTPDAGRPNQGQRRFFSADDAPEVRRLGTHPKKSLMQPVLLLHRSPVLH